MRLPGPNSNIKWKDYRITTPTFSLTPIEKPDLSPYLIHMTGKGCLVKILNGENTPEGRTVPANHGYLKSSIPDYDSGSLYNSSVVCFTESPVFTLDFFRYRSYERWKNDQQYGIGFSKNNLVQNHGVRPVLYLDQAANRKILRLCNKAEVGSIKLSENDEEHEEIASLLSEIKPLLFPLLENEPRQGFMWEREWRYPKDDGLMFNHEDIRVICCPHSEKAEIEAILGNNITDLGIQIVESWKEYDEVTNYLRKRTEVIRNAEQGVANVNDIGTLRTMKLQNDRTLHSLELYSEVFKDTATRLQRDDVENILRAMNSVSNEIAEKIKRLEEEAKAKEELAKARGSKPG